MSEIDEYLEKARSVTPYDLANRFGIRMSVARKLLREKEAEGSVIPYIRESGFVVYTTKTEIEKREEGTPIMTADVLEDISASVSHEPVFDDEMEAALAAASSAGVAVKPSKLARRRREVGEKKERRETRPEVIVEPLETPEPEKKEEKPKPKKETKKKPKKKKAEPKPKKETKKKPKKKKAEPKPKKETKKKTTKKKKVKKPKVTDIDGIGPKTEQALRDGGFKTVAAISKATVEKLSKKVEGIAETTATQYIESAKKLIAEYEKAKG